MAANIENLTNSNFQSTIDAAGTVVLVDFWAQWCGPCKQIAPMLEELAVGSSRVDLQACKLEYSIVSPK